LGNEYTGNIPFSLSLIPAAVISAILVVLLPQQSDLGVWKMDNGFFCLGAVASRPLESAMEAAEVYGETGNEEQANEVFKSNMYLTGLDFAEFATAFYSAESIGWQCNKEFNPQDTGNPAEK